jgi:hypothetical protein
VRATCAEGRKSAVANGIQGFENVQVNDGFVENALVRKTPDVRTPPTGRLTAHSAPDLGFMSWVPGLVADLSRNGHGALRVGVNWTGSRSASRHRRPRGAGSRRRLLADPQHVISTHLARPQLRPEHRRNVSFAVPGTGCHDHRQPPARRC